MPNAVRLHRVLAMVLGIRTFAREVYPRIKEQFPDAVVSGVT